MKILALEAEENIESASAPLFLRFINLLINDANHLLPEALDYMKKLRSLESDRDNGRWEGMSPMQRRQQEANYDHMGR